MTTISTEGRTLPQFDKVELSKIYDRHFADDESPEEMLQTMMLEIGDIKDGPNQKHLKDYNHDFLALLGFFNELFKPIRTPAPPTA